MAEAQAHIKKGGEYIGVSGNALAIIHENKPFRDIYMHAEQSVTNEKNTQAELEHAKIGSGIATSSNEVSKLCCGVLSNCASTNDGEDFKKSLVNAVKDINEKALTPKSAPELKMAALMKFPEKTSGHNAEYTGESLFTPIRGNVDNDNVQTNSLGSKPPPQGILKSPCFRRTLFQEDAPPSQQDRVSFSTETTYSFDYVPGNADSVAAKNSYPLAIYGSPVALGGQPISTTTTEVQTEVQADDDQRRTRKELFISPSKRQKIYATMDRDILTSRIFDLTGENKYLQDQAVDTKSKCDLYEQKLQRNGMVDKEIFGPDGWAAIQKCRQQEDHIKFLKNNVFVFDPTGEILSTKEQNDNGNERSTFSNTEWLPSFNLNLEQLSLIKEKEIVYLQKCLQDLDPKGQSSEYPVEQHNPVDLKATPRFPFAIICKASTKVIFNRISYHFDVLILRPSFITTISLSVRKYFFKCTAQGRINI